MNNEIKEILEYLKTMSRENEPDIELSREEVKLLLDYITNLQKENETRQQDIISLTYQLAKMKEENERLKVNCNLGYEELKVARDYKSRCEKAVEYIKYNDDSLYICEPDYDYEENLVDNYEPSSFREDLLNILQNGGDSQ